MEAERLTEQIDMQMVVDRLAGELAAAMVRIAYLEQLVDQLGQRLVEDDRGKATTLE